MKWLVGWEVIQHVLIVPGGGREWYRACNLWSIQGPWGPIACIIYIYIYIDNSGGINLLSSNHLGVVTSSAEKYFSNFLAQISSGLYLSVILHGKNTGAVFWSVKNTCFAVLNLWWIKNKTKAAWTSDSLCIYICIYIYICICIYTYIHP